MSCQYALLTKATIAVWQHPQVDDLDVVQKHLRETRRRYGEGCAYISVAPPDGVNPDLAFMRAVAPALERNFVNTPWMASVILGDGLQQRLTRALHSTLFTLTGFAKRIPIVSSLEEAFRVLSPAVGVEEALWNEEARSLPLLAAWMKISSARHHTTPVRTDRFTAQGELNPRGSATMTNGGSPSRCGPYRIIRQIGGGAMAAVFEAEDTHLRMRVALKRLHSHVAERPGAAGRFLREGRAAARIKHRHVVQVFGLAADTGDPYLAMELLRGGDLGTLLAQDGRLSLEPALDILLPVLAGVAAAHDAGVIHRDLKPSNIFLDRGPAGQPWPKVVDFGVSKLIDDTEASASGDGIVGTIGYVAPEQILSPRDASARSDQYALAVLLYRCVTGRMPFPSTQLMGVLRSTMVDPVIAPSRHAGELPKALDDIVLRAMSRNPAERFASVRSFGEALLQFASERCRLEYGGELRGSGTARRTSAVAATPERTRLEQTVVSQTLDPAMVKSRVFGRGA
jgi:serine/threonine-protein kinase